MEITLQNGIAPEKTFSRWLVFHWTQSTLKASEKTKSRFSSCKMTSPSKNNVMAKRQSFICSTVIFLAVCGSLVPLCNAGAGRKRPENRFNEFDTLLTVLAVLLCIGGIFVCAWCTCCGHHDYFTILDQRRFQQQTLDSDALWNAVWLKLNQCWLG